MNFRKKIKRTRHDYMLFCMATFNYNVYLKALSDFAPLKSQYDQYKLKLKKGHISRIEFDRIQENDDMTKHISKFGFEVRMSGIQTIITTAMALEAFINDLGINGTSEVYFRNHLDKMDLLSKWIVIPRITCNIEINKGKQGYENLKLLVSLRNKLVHSKSKNVMEYERLELAMNELSDQMIQVPKCYQTIGFLLEELRIQIPLYAPLKVFESNEINIESFENYMNSIMIST